MSKKKQKISLILNVLIVIMEIIGLILTIKTHGVFSFQYYTENSNLLSLIVCLIFSVFTFINLKRNKDTYPKFLNVLKYISTVSLAVTFLVVLFILSPMSGVKGYYYMLFTGSMLFHHTLCPIFAIISFIFFENGCPKGWKYTLSAISFTLIYAFISVTLNIFGIMEGPYPFLKINTQPIYMSIMWFVIIVGGSYLIAWILNLLNRKLNIKKL